MLVTSAQSGSNIQDIKNKNQMLVLKLIAINRKTSRASLSRNTGLSKMTIGKIVSELLEKGIIEETATINSPNSNYGRKPLMLTIAKNSPCICGMLIKRGISQVVLSNLDGTIFERVDFVYASLESGSVLVQKLSNAFHELKNKTSRQIIAIGISSVGPVNSSNGTILNPPYFYDIENLPITSAIQQSTKLPTFLINDANAGALAEKLYGRGQNVSNFIYLHIMNGIGAGLVLQDQLYYGNFGQSGEIGHTSITYAGAKCACGNTGCLDLYANLKNIQKRIYNLSRELPKYYQKSPLAHCESPSWCTIVDSANSGDYLALAALDEFCAYISYALIDVLNLLDLSEIIIGYDSTTKGHAIESILKQKIIKSVLSRKYHDVIVTHSDFNGDAPLIGSIALIADKIFSNEIPLLE